MKVEDTPMNTNVRFTTSTTARFGRAGALLTSVFAAATFLVAPAHGYRPTTIGPAVPARPAVESAPMMMTPNVMAPVAAIMLQFGVPQPPEAYIPPDLVLEFIGLLQTYKTSGARAGFTFQQWVIRQGVTDPFEQRVFSLLYSLYVQRHGTAVVQQPSSRPIP